MKNVALQRNGNALIDWGRHATVNGRRGEGPARVYFGEDAEILKLVIKHSRPKGKNENPHT